jgi:hypothetical protein
MTSRLFADDEQLQRHDPDSAIHEVWGSLRLAIQVLSQAVTPLAGGGNVQLPGLLQAMALAPQSPIVWKTVMFFAVAAVLLYAVWGPY